MVISNPAHFGAERGELVIDDFVTRLKDANVLDKVIYGSDGVQMPGYLEEHLHAYVAAMERNGYTKEEMRKVLSGKFHPRIRHRDTTLPNDPRNKRDRRVSHD